MQRNIFSKEAITKTQQGCIFYGALADGINHPVYGLIITPRCDIENSKVLNVNYLPITLLSEWRDSVLLSLYRADIIPKKENELKSKLNKLGKNINLDPKYKLSEEYLDAIFSEISDKSIKKELLDFWNLYDDAKCLTSIEEWKNYNNRLSELARGTMERYLLLESWEMDESHFYVIHLTQIKHLSLKCAQLLIDGLQPRTINSEADDLFFDDTPTTSKYKVVAQLTSPYIEYVCQKFSNAFFRIGIENWPHDNILNSVKDYLH